MTKYKLNYIKYISLFILLIVLLHNTLFIYADKNEAFFKYEYAKESLKTAYSFLNRAYTAGLDISENSFILNEALDKLAVSEIAIKNDEYDLALLMAGESSQISIGVIANVSSLLGEKTIVTRFTDSGIATIIIKIFLLSVIAYFIWIRIEKYYIKNLMNMKPGVVNNEH